MGTKISWCDETWNPITGCSPISEGCEHCWAKQMAEGWLRGKHGYDQVNPFDVCLHPDKFDPKKTTKHPAKWKKPRKIAVCLMGDLFHEDVPFEWMLKVFEECAKYPQHTYLFLTKRPWRTLAFEKWYGEQKDIDVVGWPPNFWFGVTIENQKLAEERLYLLMQTSFAVKYVSYEPGLGPVDFTRVEFPGGNIENVLRGDVSERAKLSGIKKLNTLDWVIVGGESGARVRPLHPEWARSMRDQCVEAGVPFFFKQWGTGRYYDDFNHLDLKREKSADIYGGGRKDTEKKGGHILDGQEWKEFPCQMSS